MFAEKSENEEQALRNIRTALKMIRAEAEKLSPRQKTQYVPEFFDFAMKMIREFENADKIKLLED